MFTRYCGCNVDHEVCNDYLFLFFYFLFNIFIVQFITVISLATNCYYPLSFPLWWVPASNATSIGTFSTMAYFISSLVQLPTFSSPLCFSQCCTVGCVLTSYKNISKARPLKFNPFLWYFYEN